MMGCTNSLNNGPTGASSSTILTITNICIPPNHRSVCERIKMNMYFVKLINNWSKISKIAGNKNMGHCYTFAMRYHFIFTQPRLVKGTSDIMQRQHQSMLSCWLENKAVLHYNIASPPPPPIGDTCDYIQWYWHLLAVSKLYVYW